MRFALCLILGIITASSAAPPQPLVVSGDTLYIYEEVSSEPVLDYLALTAHVNPLSEGGIPVERRTPFGQTRIGLLAALARFQVIYSVQYELAGEVYPDSMGVTTRLGVRGEQLLLNHNYKGGLEGQALSLTHCDTGRTAPEDTLLYGDRQGERCCASYLPAPVFSFAAMDSLIRNMYTAHKDSIDTRRAEREAADVARDAEEESRLSQLLGGD